jgi:hypothetical protein
MAVLPGLAERTLRRLFELAYGDYLIMEYSHLTSKPAPGCDTEAELQPHKPLSPHAMWHESP